MSEAIMTIASATDVITLTGTDIAEGFIYDDDALSAWFKLPEVAVKLNKRPNAHGTYLPDQLFTNSARIPIPGQFFGASSLDAAIARDRLSAMFNDGRPVSVAVADERGTTSRIGFIVAFEPEWKPDGHFTFLLDFDAPDPRRYGDLVELSAGLPSPSSGLVWPLGTTPGLFWDWGTAGATGRVSFTNDGNTTTYPVIYVGSGGNLVDGFTVTEVDTGRELRYPVTTGGNVVRLDNRTHRATINGGDVTGDLTRKEWFGIPAHATREYQLTALGAPTGTPLMQLFIANANL